MAKHFKTFLKYATPARLKGPGKHEIANRPGSKAPELCLPTAPAKLKGSGD